MKLEFLAEGAEACPLIRLYDFAPAGLTPLIDGLSARALGEREFVAVHQLPGVKSIDECELFLLVGKRDPS